jgi:pimeloyl-ACP methyl ester carboxylesterase
MLSEYVDSLLAGIAAQSGEGLPGGPLPTRYVQTPVGAVRAHDTGSNRPCVVMVPDGPNVIEHCAHLIGLLSPRLRVVCFDMPGFGFSFAHSSRGPGGCVADAQEGCAWLAPDCASGRVRSHAAS